MSDLPTPACKGKVSESGADEQSTQANIDTQASTCLAPSSTWKRKFKTKPRKVCHQRPYVKDDKSPKHTSKPRKVCRQRSAAKEDLYKEITLIESPIRRASLNCVSSLTLAKALPP